MTNITLAPVQPDQPSHLMATYGRQAISFVRGRGAYLYTADGTEYLDALTGIAVCGLGHAHPEIAAAIADQAATLIDQGKYYEANAVLKKAEDRMRFDVIDGTGQPCQIEIEMLFRAMGDQKAEDVLKGLELTGLWLNETDTLDQSVFLFGWPRTGRYPPAKMGGCQWRGVIADFNAPDIDNWTYDFFVEGKLGLNEEQENQLKDVLGPRFGIGYWKQPGGLSKDPPPENIQNLPEGYYEGLLLAYANQPNYLRRFVHNEFGAVRNGQPVCARRKLKPRQSWRPRSSGRSGVPRRAR